MALLSGGIPCADLKRARAGAVYRYVADLPTTSTTVRSGRAPD